MQDIINGRCGWCGTDELYVKYHDEEWGKTVTDDKTLFEFLVLESAGHPPPSERRPLQCYKICFSVCNTLRRNIILFRYYGIREKG